MDKSIVIIYDNEPRASSQLIARGFERTHYTVIKIITKYKLDFEEFGKLPFEKFKPVKKLVLNESTAEKFQGVGNKGSRVIGRPVIAYLLNEEQTAFLGTLFKNSKIVVEFKKRLIKEFFKQRRLLQQVASNQYNAVWVQQRIEGKVRRLEETSIIKTFITYAEKQGSANANWYYKIFTNMQNSALFIIDGKFQNLREVMTASQLMTIGVADNIVKKTIVDGMKKNLFYKEIYKQAKANMIIFAELHGQSKIINEMKKLQDPNDK